MPANKVSSIEELSGPMRWFCEAMASPTGRDPGLDSACASCRAYQAGEHEDTSYYGFRTHVCELVADGTVRIGPCPCGCERR